MKAKGEIRGVLLKTDAQFIIKEKGVEPTVPEIAQKAQFAKDPKKNLAKAWEIQELINAREGKVSLEGITEEGYEPGEDDPTKDFFARSKGDLPEIPLSQGPHFV